jgi:hypothetical protein
LSAIGIASATSRWHAGRPASELRPRTSCKSFRKKVFQPDFRVRDFFHELFLTVSTVGEVSTSGGCHSRRNVTPPCPSGMHAATIRPRPRRESPLEGARPCPSHPAAF